MNATDSKTVLQSVKHFGWLDFTVFGAMLGLSAIIGLYYGFFAKQKQNTTKEYLMGGKTMGIVPISLSLIARYLLCFTACNLYLLRTIELLIKRQVTQSVTNQGDEEDLLTLF